MAAINKAIIVGNLGRDPEVRYGTNGDAMCSLAVATTDRWKDKNTGETKEATEWHRVTAFGRLAEIMAQYLKKGAQVYIEGRLRTRKYTDKEGVERYSTEIVADQMQMLGSRQLNDGAAPQPAAHTGQHQTAQYQGAHNGNGAARPAPRPAAGGGGHFGDDIPFAPMSGKLY